MEIELDGESLKHPFSLNARFKVTNDSKFNKLVITEKIDKDGKYCYTGEYDVDMKYKATTEDKTFNKLVNENYLHDEGTLYHEWDERPKCLVAPVFGVPVQHQDDEEDTVDYAIRDWIDSLGIWGQLEAVSHIFLVNLPKVVIEKAWYEENYQLTQEGKKIAAVSYDVRKPKVDSIVVDYEDGTWHRFLVNNITNKNVEEVFPGETLLTLYNKLSTMIEEDYDGTISLLSELFGFDLKTMKGAKIDD